MQRAFRFENMKIVGDPHLGRSFINGVPLHRRGEREQMIKDAFIRSLDPEGAFTHVVMGDLFDKPKVSLETIMFAAEAYEAAATANFNTTYLILAGNHDLSRDLTQVSALQIFEKMVYRPRRKVGVCIEVFVYQDKAFFPWSPSQTAEEVVRTSNVKGAPTAFGHWDLDGHSSNLIPIQALKDIGVTRVFNGHVHLPRVEIRDGLEIINVGSLLPLAHGEGEEMHVTIGLDELRADPELYVNKCVRLRLEPGEELDFEVDCLQLQVVRPEHQIDLTVDYDSTFDMKELVDRAGEGVPEHIWAKVKERI